MKGSNFVSAGFALKTLAFVCCAVFSIPPLSFWCVCVLSPVCLSGCETGFSRVVFCLILSRNVGKCRGKSQKVAGRIRNWVTSYALVVKNILRPRNRFFSPIGLNLTSGNSAEKRLNCISTE